MSDVAAGQTGPHAETILDVDDAVNRLAVDDPIAADVVKLHFCYTPVSRSPYLMDNLALNCVAWVECER